MFRFEPDLTVFLHREPIDFRAGINSLVALVEQSEVAPFGPTVFSIFKWNAGRSRCRFHRGQHREVSFIRGLVRQT